MSCMTRRHIVEIESLVHLLPVSLALSVPSPAPLPTSRVPVPSSSTNTTTSSSSSSPTVEHHSHLTIQPVRHALNIGGRGHGPATPFSPLHPPYATSSTTANVAAVFRQLLVPSSYPHVCMWGSLSQSESAISLRRVCNPTVRAQVWSKLAILIALDRRGAPPL